MSTPQPKEEAMANGYVGLEHVLNTVEANHHESIELMTQANERLGNLEVDVAVIKEQCKNRPNVCLLEHRVDRENLLRSPVSTTTNESGKRVWVMWSVFLFIAIGVGNLIFDVLFRIIQNVLH